MKGFGKVRQQDFIKIGTKTYNVSRELKSAFDRETKRFQQTQKEAAEKTEKCMELSEQKIYRATFGNITLTAKIKKDGVIDMESLEVQGMSENDARALIMVLNTMIIDRVQDLSGRILEINKAAADDMAA